MPDVGTRFVLRDVALEAAFQHLTRRHEAARCQPGHGEDPLSACHALLEPRSAFSQGPLGLIAATAIDQVEHHQQGRRRHLLVVGIAQPLEVGPELLVVDRHLAVARTILSVRRSARHHFEERASIRCGPLVVRARPIQDARPKPGRAVVVHKRPCEDVQMFVVLVVLNRAHPITGVPLDQHRLLPLAASSSRIFARCSARSARNG
jgi:hypothetical protein